MVPESRRTLLSTSTAWDLFFNSKLKSNSNEATNDSTESKRSGNDGKNGSQGLAGVGFLVGVGVACEVVGVVVWVLKAVDSQSSSSSSPLGIEVGSQSSSSSSP